VFSYISNSLSLTQIMSAPAPSSMGATTADGSLQNFDIVALAQIVTLMLSVVEALYFGYMLTINKFKDPVWEPLWVTLVEACVYAILLATGSHRFEMKDGSMVNIISPMAWCLACPIAMSFMMRMSWPEAPQRTTLALIMNLEAVLLIGIISGMSKDWGMKVTLFVFAALLYALLCTTLIRGMFYGGVKPRTTEAKFILLFFLSTWMIFPIVWLLGPSMLGLWSYEVTLLLFAAGDIFAKNIFTYIGYKYTEQLLTAEIEMKELEQNGGMEMLGNGPLTVGAVLNRDNRKDDTSSQISEVDYLHIASVIEHLEEGNTIRSNPLKKRNKCHRLRNKIQRRQKRRSSFQCRSSRKRTHVGNCQRPRRASGFYRDHFKSGSFVWWCSYAYPCQCQE